MTDVSEIIKDKDYEYGFHDNVKPVYSTGKGLTETIVREISAEKHEPEWMLNYRLAAYHAYLKMPEPSFGPDLSKLDLENMKFYQKATDKQYRDWNDVPEKIKTTFDRLGVPEAERKYLAGSSAQYESEVVYHNMQEQFEKLGIIFTDTDTALQKYPELFKKWFGKLVKPTNNKYSALNSAVWSGGTFIYVPKGVSLTTPIQSYFRLNAENSGQFERTLIIVDEGAHVEYVEGCTAPTYKSDSLHAAVVEVNVLPHAYCRYTTIQNWSNNVYSLETKRAQALEGAIMEWVDGNLGSKVTMKYPSVYLNGEGARGTMLSIAVAGKNIDSDTGAQMIHNAPNTSSSVVSKSIAKDGGAVDYRGKVKFGRHSDGSFAHVECDTIIMDEQSSSDTIPYNEILNNNVSMEHEAKVSKISEEQLYYLMSRGIPEAKATEMIIMSFVEPFTKELPMEYAVELNRLISFEMEGSIG
ncbi:Fe-S cluster assembly protein SufB [Lentilactobacillus kefiri]|uniref:ABC superfamily ATP binding cassette transporter, membrane protein n=2 Tax=Lentilactobacillus kefiri TaxID=33962 RepID=A0A8E1UZK6_LENKE|nr:Fe-S cluster assembly protein SufB [Lentilactobacillus kefiri]KRL73673.1 ABC superfamily ATP binding cassette transporter, membrane protein [Lentilactobacillus parakefiri DSM 10551]KRM49777.1 ABC superfamily ATP binding cassette transporter, membrane protein [Lentilactobacillus kefiri DSM 20587 = JCM 5818]MCJ2161581.1 Fe-S cluster assembly protein SufB [Lentilactobacillus kefiri]MDH5108236.1 Fe-S cluster assembly protein SufB [Lentilactobacillus kefiri]MDM7492638.1 Fe-S cluster assembly pro